MERDPICGMTVDPQNAAATSEFEGKTYYFCSAGCKQTFDAEPARYVAAQQPAMESRGCC